MTKKQLYSNLSKTKQRSGKYFVVKNILIILLLLLLSIASIIAVATFLRDLLILNTFYGLWENLPWQIVTQGFTELVAIGIIMLIICYIIYRQTDWPLVRNEKLLLMIMIILLITGGGIATFTKGLHGSLDNNRVALQRLPHRKDRDILISTQLRKRGIVIGVVDSISTEEQTITIRTPREIIILSYDKEPSKILEGDTVKINAKDDEIISIRKIPRLRGTRK